ncbi:hypothetical protein WCE55_00790 [Luteimonas sp. MJ293]|uniref:hypothetical protein n=1 Tax=Luteimonas sp. MJ146 TaxID=3129240 RepID=UPI0031BB4584
MTTALTREQVQAIADSRGGKKKIEALRSLAERQYATAHESLTRNDNARKALEIVRDDMADILGHITVVTGEVRA